MSERRVDAASTTRIDRARDVRASYVRAREKRLTRGIECIDRSGAPGGT
jgi:hypothetical protein